MAAVEPPIVVLTKQLHAACVDACHTDKEFSAEGIPKIDDCLQFCLFTPLRHLRQSGVLSLTKVLKNWT